MRIILSGILVAIAATPALACPTRADLEADGIEVRFADETRVVYTLRDANIIREISHFPDPSEDFWVDAYLGIYPVADGAMRDGEASREDMVTSRYPETLPDLPRVEPEMEWSGVLTGFDGRGSEVEKTTLAVSIGAKQSVTIGFCTYDAMSAQTEFSYSDGGDMAEFRYLPDLGIAVQIGSGPGGGSPEAYYRPISIRAVGDEE
ncbi:MAG: hypothetical protein AAF367_09320 [Pseudomonadota bacterium]